jgi:hypothetical protein
MVALLNKAFEENLTLQEEAVLERLEQEWLAMCQAHALEDFDYYTPRGKSYKAKEHN